MLKKKSGEVPILTIPLGKFLKSAAFSDKTQPQPGQETNSVIRARVGFQLPYATSAQHSYAVYSMNHCSYNKTQI